MGEREREKESETVFLNTIGGEQKKEYTECEVKTGPRGTEKERERNRREILSFSFFLSFFRRQSMCFQIGDKANKSRQMTKNKTGQWRF